MNSMIHILFAICLMTVSTMGLTYRDAGDHARNAIGFFIGFGIGLVIVALGLCCWKYFESFDLCHRSKKEQQYAAPPETGASFN